MSTFLYTKIRGVTFAIFSIVGGLAFGGAVAFAATTISTNISTDGTLAVTGLATLSGGATTTSITLLNGETITNATDGTIALTGAATISSTLSVTSLATFLGGATTTSLTLLNGETISNGTDGTITFGASNTALVGTASSSAIRVGDEPAAPAINGMVFGYCTFTDVTLAASSTNGFANCTVDSSVTGALVAGDRVFVQATSSLESQYLITAASSTGASTIQLRFLNTGLGTADGTLSGTSVNFWALR